MPTHADYVTLALGATETTETDLGDITIPVTGGTIIGVWGICANATTTAAEGNQGFFRLASNDINIAPARFPVSLVSGVADSYSFNPMIIPVNIPVAGKATIECYMVLSLAQTGACTGAVGLIWEG